MRTSRQNANISSRNVANNGESDSKRQGKDKKKIKLSPDSSKKAASTVQEREKQQDDENEDLTDEEEELEVDLDKLEKETQARKRPAKKTPTSKHTSPKPTHKGSEKDNNPDSSRKKTTKSQTSGIWGIVGYSLALIAVVLGVILAPVIISEEFKDLIPEYVKLIVKGYDENTKFAYGKIFDNKIKELMTQFPNQTSRFWKIIKTRGLAHLNDKEPKQPLVMMLGAPPSAHGVIDCIGWMLAKSLDPGNDDLGYIDGNNFTSSGGHEAKRIMDEKLEKLFQKGDRSALILHLELLPPPSPILFYSYCDNENAKFRHAGMVFTVHLPEEPNMSLSQAEQEGTVEKYLSEVVWNKEDYDYDAVAALLSRIGDTVALVSGETDGVIKSHCPVHLS